MPLSDLERGILGAISGASGYWLQAHQEKRQQKIRQEDLDLQNQLMMERQTSLQGLMSGHRMSLQDLIGQQAMDRTMAGQEGADRRATQGIGANFITEGLRSRDRRYVADTAAASPSRTDKTDYQYRDYRNYKLADDILTRSFDEFEIERLQESGEWPQIQSDFQRLSGQLGPEEAMLIIREGFIPGESRSFLGIDRLMKDGPKGYLSLEERIIQAGQQQAAPRSDNPFLTPGPGR